MEGNQLVQRRFQVKTNYFPIKTAPNIFKYTVNFEPELQEKDLKSLQLQYRNLRPKFQEKFEVYFIFNGILFSPNSLETEVITTNYEDVQYKVTISKCGFLSFTDKGVHEAENFLGRFLKTLQRMKSLKMIGRKYFVPTRSQNYSQYGLDIWPGYDTSLHNINGSYFYNIDCSFKVLREETVYKRLVELKGKSPQLIKEEFVGTTVITRYNNLLYKITDICFDKNPNYEFKDQKGNSVILKNYYFDKYGLKISDLSQPLILNIDEKTKKEVLLIPELCSMTGLSDSQRNNFHLMKAIATFTKPPPAKRYQEYTGLISHIKSEEKSKDNLSKWKIDIIPDSLVVDAMRLNPGKYLMGNNQAIDLDSKDLDRLVQTQMYSQPTLNSWTIAFNSRDENSFQNFQSTFQQCLQSFHYGISPPNIMKVNGNNFDSWKSTLCNLDKSTQMVVLILGGPKKNAFNYTDIKRLLTVDYSIPSQVVQTKTLEGKGLRSICNKILIQMCAKVGGIPWCINNLPFTDVPTMLCGLDVYHQTKLKNKSVLAYCSTVDRGFAKYWSTVRVKEVGQEIGIDLQCIIEDSLNQFKALNNIFPQRIIFFRDGVANNQRQGLETIEIPAIRRASEKLNLPIKLIYICINKRINTKFFTGDDLKNIQNLQNPLEGTSVPGLGEEFKDFFLVSHKTTQGSATPSHYHVLVNDLIQEDKMFNNELFEKVQSLCFKLCYQYFNWVGAIKTPAPVHYAHKLAELVGDKFLGNSFPNENLGKKSSLYFI